MRKLLATSAALAALLIAVPASTDLVFAKDKGESASNGGGNGKSDSAPGQNKADATGDANAGHGNDADGFDEDNPGKSLGARRDKDAEEDDDDDVATDTTRSVNVVSTLNSPRKLEQALAQFEELEDPTFTFVPFDDQDLDVALKGGSPRSIQNALRRNPEIAEQIEAVLGDRQLEDVVGLAVDGNDVTIFVR